MLDGRRYRSEAPSLQESAESLSDIIKPNGESYVFITEREVLGTELILREEAFVQIVMGSLPEDSYEEFKTAIIASISEATDDLQLYILANEEHFGMDG